MKKQPFVTKEKLEEIIACLDNFDLWVNIVTPN